MNRCLKWSSFLIAAALLMTPISVPAQAISGRRWALAHRISKGDARNTLRHLYRPWWLSRIAFPIAMRRYRARLQDKSCNHIDCRCVWCEHGMAMASETAA